MSSIKNILASYKDQLTKVKNALEKFSVNPQRMKDTNTLIELENHLEDTERIEKEYIEFHLQVPEFQVQEQEEEVIAFLDDCAEVASQIFRLKYKVKNPVRSQSSSYSSGTEMEKLLSTMLQQQEEQRQHHILNNQRFDTLYRLQRGDMCALNDKLTNTPKMHSLQTFLNEKDFQVFSHQTISDDNEDLAWRLIQNKYDDETQLTNSYDETILNQSSITNSSPNDMRKSFTTSTSNTQDVKTVNDFDEGDDLLIHLLVQKLDAESQVLWSREIGNDVPTLMRFEEYITRTSIEHQESCSSSLQSETTPNNGKIVKRPKRKKTKVSSIVATNSQDICLFCKRHCHKLQVCRDFLALAPQERFKIANDLNVCQNCFSEADSVTSCYYRLCTMCAQDQNVLIHDLPASPNILQKDKTKIQSSSPKKSQDLISRNCIREERSSERVLVATAGIKILDEQSNIHYCRAILDSSSQTNLISTSLYEKLNIDKNYTNASSLTAHHETTLHILIDKCNSTEVMPLDCLLSNNIAEDHPILDLKSESLFIPHVILADPDWNTNAPIDLVIGGQLLWSLIHEDVIKTSSTTATFRSSVFGWLIIYDIADSYCKVPPESPSGVYNISTPVASKESDFQLEHQNDESYTVIKDCDNQVVSQTAIIVDDLDDGESFELLEEDCQVELEFDNVSNSKSEICQVEQEFDNVPKSKSEFFHAMNPTSSEMKTECLQSTWTTFLSHNEDEIPFNHCVLQKNSAGKPEIVYHENVKSQISCTEVVKADCHELDLRFNSDCIGSRLLKNMKLHSAKKIELTISSFVDPIFTTNYETCHEDSLDLRSSQQSTDNLKINFQDSNLSSPKSSKEVHIKKRILQWHWIFDVFILTNNSYLVLSFSIPKYHQNHIEVHQ